MTKHALAALAEAKRLHDLGFAIIWIRPRAKNPVESGWTTGPRAPWAGLKASFRDGYNVGVRTGTPSLICQNIFKNEAYLCCIDVDIKDKAYLETALECVKKLTGEVVCPEVISGSGNGSRHLYCVTKEPFKMITVAKEKDKWEVAVYSDGRQMVLPPSIHPSGAPYRWVFEPKAGLPLLEFVKNSDAESKKSKKGAHRPLDEAFTIDRALDVRFAKNIPENIRALILEGVWNEELITDRSAYLPKVGKALKRAGFTKMGVLTIMSDPTTFLGECAYDHVQSGDRHRAMKWLWQYSVKNIWGEEDDDIEGSLAGVEVSKELAEAGSAPVEGWRKELRYSIVKNGPNKGKKRIVDQLHNLNLIFSNVMPATPLFKKDEFKQREFYACDAPWGAKKGTTLSDIDVLLAKGWFSTSEFKIEPKNQTIEEAMAVVGHRNSVHPVRDWLNSLEWDGIPRISTWIKDYVQGEAPEPYLSKVSAIFFLGMVARVFEPGCQWDYVLILEGKQGTKKSSLARVLASDEWFCENLPDLRDKDAMLNLQGAWLIELAEMKNLKHSDSATIKSFITRRKDRVRAPYGKRSMDVPRQCVFIGSINESEYLKDETGGRRFWPVKVGETDLEGIKEVREQLFAEAKYVYDRKIEKLYLEGKALEQAEEMQENRQLSEEIAEMKEAFIEFREEKPEGFNFDRLRLKELFNGPWQKWEGKNYSLQNGALALINVGYEKYRSNGIKYWKLTKRK